MSTSATVSVTVSFPPDDGQPVANHVYSSSITFDQKDDDIYTVTGAGTESVTLKGIAKVLFIKLNATATQPVNINIGTDDWELAPGGLIMVVAPSPSVGISSLDIVHTADATVHLIGLA